MLPFVGYFVFFTTHSEHLTEVDSVGENEINKTNYNREFFRWAMTRIIPCRPVGMLPWVR